MANEFQHLSVGTSLTQAEFEATDGTSHILDSQATGDIIYASSSSVLSRLGVGTNGDLLNLGSGVPAWTSAISTAKTIADDILLGLGTGADGVLLNRSTILATNTALTGVMIGTPVTPAVAANSLLISNVTASGDYLLALNNGGHSQAWHWVDSSAGTQTLFAAGVARILLNSTGGSFTGTWSDLGTVTTVDINGGTVDGAAIGAASHSTIKGTTIDATTDFTIGSTVITDDTLTFGAAGDIVQSSGTLTFTSAAGVGLGRAHNTRGWITIGAAYTAASSTKAHMVNITEGLTGHANDVQMHALLLNVNHVTQTQTADIADITELRVTEPGITDNLTGDITRASTIMIDGIPGEGEANYGLLIDGGASDAHYIGLASSDVATGLSTGTPGGAVSPDDFLVIEKVSSTQGGVLVTAMSEGDGGSNQTLFFDAVGGTPITTDVVGSGGVINLSAGEHDQANGLVDMAATSNIFTVGEIHTDKSRLTRLLVKANGVLHLTNATPVALDDEDDVQLVRAMQREGSSSGIVDNEYDNPFYSYAKLVELGLAGEKDENGVFLFSVQNRLHAHEGAMWQTYTRVRKLEEKLALAEQQLAAIGA